MEIISGKYKSCSLKLNHIKVDFDSEGKAEVPKELGESILEKYGDILNPVKIKPKVEDVKSDNKEFIKLQQEKDMLKSRINELKGKLAISEESVNQWKEQYDNAIQAVKTNFVRVEGEGSEDETELTISNLVLDQDIELILELSKKSVKDLKIMAVELKLPKEEWEEMTGDNLKFYLAKKAVNANS